MRTYYLFSSQVDTTAEVESQSPEKAITKYLSYLVDSGQIAHTERGSIRPFVRWSHIEPGEFNTDVKLSQAGIEYLKSSPSEVSSLPTQEGQYLQQSQPQGYYGEAAGDYGSSPNSGALAPSVLPASNVGVLPGQSDSIFGDSPIMALSQKSRGR